MQLDPQSARELVEAVQWWEQRLERLWNCTVGRLLGDTCKKSPDTEENSEKVVALQRRKDG